jgi:hypothetical protein
MAEQKEPTLTDEDLMTFGKHKGERVADVPASYLLWWWDQIHEEPRDGNEPLKNYIINNWDTIRMDAPNTVPLNHPEGARKY